jgi:hypothetical protein
MFNRTRLAKMFSTWVIASVMAIPALAGDYTITVTNPTAGGSSYAPGANVACTGTTGWVDIYPFEYIPNVLVTVTDDVRNMITSTYPVIATVGWYSGSFSTSVNLSTSAGNCTVLAYACDSSYNKMGPVAGVTVTIGSLPPPPMP